MGDLTDAQRDALRRARRFEGTLYLSRKRASHFVDARTARALERRGLAEVFEPECKQLNFMRLTDEGREALEEA